MYTTGRSTGRGTELRTLHILLNKPAKVQPLKHIFVTTIGAKRVEYVGGVNLFVEVPF